MATETSNSVPGLDLTDDEYTIQQHLFRSRFKVFDRDGNLVLRAKKKRFKLKEQFPFVDADGDEVFRVKAGKILDHAGDYAIETPDGRTIAVLEKNWTLFLHSWKVRDPDTDALLATIESEGAVVEALRNVSDLFGMLPHTYTIEAADGSRIGHLKGKLSLRDEYTLRIDDAGDVPRESLVAAAVAIDMLEGN